MKPILAVSGSRKADSMRFSDGGASVVIRRDSEDGHGIRARIRHIKQKATHECVQGVHALPASIEVPAAPKSIRTTSQEPGFHLPGQ